MEDKSNPIKRPELYWFIAALIVGSMLATSLLAVRYFYWSSLGHLYLAWNLFLAWVPVGFAFLAWRYKEDKIRLYLFAALWLLFLPNAPYLVTDLIHLRARPPVPVWFDMVLLQSFIGLGLLLGFVSLYKMQLLTAHFYGKRASWIFVLVVVALTGFGIYLGRVQRFNSWDAIINPIGLFTELFGHLATHTKAVSLFSLLYGVFFLGAYVVLYGLTHLRFEVRELRNPKNES
ncbi:MAG: DUF1361 domain-containing protein [Limisphaerales bacterium]